MIFFTTLTETSFCYDWEVSLMEWIQFHLGTSVIHFAAIMSAFGEEFACVAVLGLLYWCLDKEYGRKVGVAMLFAGTVNPMIKNLALRRRPYCDHTSIKCLKPVAPDGDIYDMSAQGYSFPSGHSTNAVSLYSAMAFFRRDRWLTAAGIVIPLLCGLSRICLGVHYPTDVLCGWLLGLMSIFIIYGLEKVIGNSAVRGLILLSMTIPGCLYCRSDDYFTSFGILAGFIFAQEFEKRYVKFENTRSPLRCVLRLIGGVAVFFGMRTLLRLPFSDEFLNSSTSPAHIVRALRYFVIMIVDIAVYPMVFRLTDRFFPKKIGKNGEENLS